MFNGNIVFFGAGSMAEAMIAGMVASGTIPLEQIQVTNKSNPERLNALKEKYNIQITPREALELQSADLLILAMKPKDIEDALDRLKDQLMPHHVVISLLAGISTAFIEKRLGNHTRVIRVMPNTSSTIGESATAMATGQFVSNEDKQKVEELLKACGAVYILEEEHIDIFTGIAGSGPAYFYYLIEHIEKVGEAAGLDKQLARQMGAQTILGAAKMIMKNDATPTELREKVTSPNGTTAKGLEALAAYGGGKAIREAVLSATRRSKEMSLHYARPKTKTVDQD
ncbi:pyrroline-5-carboxylate reductase 1 [Pullulanibacillus camelliae]|uniref:Pyrroline-5-carboxylate reductase n=1 Tax=Pullulanibacillus camelliae TaxID=1707096 RepID=A0A8J2YHU6_9BACL|nr:pyrroline-5-carboxylate reductase [Pullulanibacillus camelliae]GGE43946.1 pyrroline-5-carboxylate reductase 1 [Pullulanibacillus camelliae]